MNVNKFLIQLTGLLQVSDGVLQPLRGMFNNLEPDALTNVLQQMNKALIDGLPTVNEATWNYFSEALDWTGKRDELPGFINVPSCVFEFHLRKSDVPSVV